MMRSWTQAALAAASICSRVAPGRPSAMFARTVSWHSATSWKTMANWDSSHAWVASRTSTPPTRTVPESASQKRPTRRAIVVFPPPEGPTIAVTVPGSTEKDTSLRTGASCEYPKETPSKETAPGWGAAPS